MASNGFLGTWCGSSMYSYTITDFPRLVVKQRMVDQTYAHYAFGGSQLVAEGWNQTATLGPDGNMLYWSDGSTWKRISFGPGCSLFDRTAAVATPAPPSYFYLGGRGYVSGGAPIAQISSFAAIWNDGTGGLSCITFKNTGIVTATRVVFYWSLGKNTEDIEDEGTLDRRGEFSPDVEIHGWHSVAERQSGQGHRDYSKNCMGWKPDNAAQARAYPYLRRYGISIKRVEYADGTTWPPASPVPSPEPSSVPSAVPSASPSP